MTATDDSLVASLRTALYQSGWSIADPNDSPILITRESLNGLIDECYQQGLDGPDAEDFIWTVLKNAYTESA